MILKNFLIPATFLCVINMIGNGDEVTKRLFELVQSCEKHCGNYEKSQELLIEIDACFNNGASTTNNNGVTIESLLDAKIAALNEHDSEYQSKKIIYGEIKDVIACNLFLGQSNIPVLIVK